MNKSLQINELVFRKGIGQAVASIFFIAWRLPLAFFNLIPNLLRISTSVRHTEAHLGPKTINIFPLERVIADEILF